MATTRLLSELLSCRRRHRAAHEEGFSMELAPKGEARFYRPDGRHSSAGRLPSLL
jgi:hypothetical protein